MRVLLAGGGTAGHINPAIAIAGYIKSQKNDAQILFAGTPNGMEANLVPKSGYDFAPIEVLGFKRSFSPSDIKHNTKAVMLLAKSGARAKKIISDFKPDIVVGTGGYVSGPIVRQAKKMGIKTLIHEQNAFPGVTNKLLAKDADAVCLAVAEAKDLMPADAKIYITGNPVRDSILQVDKETARKKLGLNDNMCILSFGGSLGANTINKLAADLIEWETTQTVGDINHIHGFGKHGRVNFPALLREKKIDLEKHPQIKVHDYIYDMDLCLAAADLVICRAGAITLSELQATGKASILIPAPYVSENHQFHNAMVLQNHGAAVVIEDKNYDKEKMIEVVKSFYNDRNKLIEYGENAKSLAILDTTKRIYDIICDLLG